MSQLALPLALDDYAVFDSFWPAGNEAAVRFLEDTVATGQGPGAYLFGAAASGKSHLLQAACARAGDRAIYLPLPELLEAGPAILDGAATRSLVCIDDVDRIAGNNDWEQALVGLWHDLADAGGVLIAAGSASVRATDYHLADLASRLAQLTPFRLRPLSEADRIEALALRARHRGVDLPGETARYLLSRSRRDMASLYRLLDRLDREALRAQRRLTIPFVRDVLKA